MKLANMLVILLLASLQTSFGVPRQTEKSAITLELGRPIEKELSGGQSHEYLIQLAAGQYLQTVVDQRGIDVGVALIGLRGENLLEVDSPNGNQGPEILFFIASAPGAYHLRIAALDKAAATGMYQVKIEEIRAATEPDKNRVAGQKAVLEARQAESRGTPEMTRQAADRYRAAANYYRVSGNSKEAAEALFLAATALVHLGDARQAIESLSQSVPLWQASGDQENTASAYNRMGALYSRLGEHQRGLDAHLQALQLSRAAGDLRGEAETLANLGIACLMAAKRQQALEYFEQSMPLLTKLGDRGGKAYVLNLEGRTHDDLGDTHRALECFQKALPLAQSTGDNQLLSNILNNLGAAYSDLGEPQKALEYYGQALPLRRTLGDQAGEADVLSNMGAVYNHTGEKQKALEHYDRALSLHRAVGNRGGEASTLNNMGSVYRDLGDSRKALDLYNQALPLRRAVGDRSGEAATLNNIGTVYHDLGEFQKALEFYQQVLPMNRALGDKRGEAQTLNNIGAAHSALGDKEKALEYYDQSLPLRRETGDRSGEAMTLTNMGAVSRDQGNKQKALELYDQALALNRAAASKGGEADTLNNMGAVYQDSGEQRNALDYYERALSLYQEVGARGGMASTLNNLGGICEALGEVQRALDYYDRALSLAKATGTRTTEASALNNIGALYLYLGEEQQALEYYEKALLINRTVGDRDSEATVLVNIGVLYGNLNELQKALSYFNQALTLLRPAAKGATLNNIGTLYRFMGERQKALSCYEEALPLVRESKDRLGEARTLNNIAVIYDDMGDMRRAADMYLQSLSLHKAAGNRDGEAQTLFGLARTDREFGNMRQAQERLEAALQILESLRSNITSPDLRASYFASAQRYQRFYVDVLMEQHRAQPNGPYEGMAITASERMRARSLLEMLAEARTDIRQGADPALIKQEKEVRQQLSDKSDHLLRITNGKPNEKSVDILKKDISDLETENARIAAAIRKNSPKYAALTQPQPLQLKQIQQQILDKDTVLLEYSIGEEHSYLWVVAPDSLQSYMLPKREQIEVAVRSMLESLTARNRNPKSESAEQRRDRLNQAETQYGIAAAKVSSMLLAPAASRIAGKRLLIVADGALQYVPFEALPQPGAKAPAYVPLMETHEVISIPSASLLAELRSETAGRKAPPHTLAVFADPVFDKSDPRLAPVPAGTDAPPKLANLGLQRSARETGLSGEELQLPRLPFTRQEAEQISSFAGEGEVMKALDLLASIGTATGPEVPNYKIVHFATHGLLNSEHPALSGLVLSLVDEKGRPQNGFLKLQDIYNLNLPADLVVLSACQTALGKEIRGEGLVGLTRGFMYAGAKRVVSSLWKVDDVATAELMKRFYQGMLAEKMRPAEALRQAQLAMWRQKRWASPYYWAAFILQGEWR
jgi:CHAT domain-containing protein/Tfp pilus assembly protein PilF